MESQKYKTDKETEKIRLTSEINLPTVQKLSNQGLIVIKYYSLTFYKFYYTFLIAIHFEITSLLGVKD